MKHDAGLFAGSRLFSPFLVTASVELKVARSSGPCQSGSPPQPFGAKSDELPILTLNRFNLAN